MHWVNFEDAHVLEYRDPPFVERASSDKNLLAMVLEGELDAAIFGAELPTDPRLKSIIPNADLNQSYFFINPNFKEPYVESWNFAIQRSLPGNLVLDVAYVGNHGVDQPALYQLNASTTLGGGRNSQPLFAKRPS